MNAVTIPARGAPNRKKMSFGTASCQFLLQKGVTAFTTLYTGQDLRIELISCKDSAAVCILSYRSRQNKGMRPTKRRP